MAQKRMLESGEPEVDDRVKRPRVRFADMIMEALRRQSLQTVLEPLLRKVVCEEVERALEKHVPAKIISTAKQIQGSESRNMRLQFTNKLSLPLFTGSRVEGDQGLPIQILISDASTGKRVTSGPVSLLKVEIIVLEGDFGHDDDEEWTETDFENYVVREREGKRPLLTGELIVSLKDGLGSLGELSFTDNSSWIRSRKFRLGARVVGGNYDGIRIREAKTEAFTVKDHRGELYKKHYPPALDDEVWRLEKIGKDGAFHKRLSNHEINTVQDFLRLLVTNPQQLRHILGNGMSNKMWEGTVEHAKTCTLNKKCYVYHADKHNNFSIIFNVICEPVGIVSEGQIFPMARLSEALKPVVEKLSKSAYEHWNQVIEHEDEFLISNASHSLALKNAHIEDSEVHGDPSYQRTVFASEQDGHGAHMTGSRYMIQQQSMKHATGEWLQADGSVNMAASNQVSMVTGSVQQSIATQAMGSPSLALGPRQTHMYPNPLLYNTNNLNSFIYRNGSRSQHVDKGLREANRNDWTSETHEGPISFYHTNSSNELVTNCRGPDAEDLQNWIPIINGGTTEQGYNFFSNTPGDQGFTFASFSPTENLNFNMAGDRLHGKAYLGWLKIKAALKWGISVRKVAAAKRAKLEELED